MPSRSIAVAALVVLASAQACKKEPPARPAPPAPSAESAAKPGACAGGGGQLADPATAAFFPQQVAGYCIDPNGETRTFGEAGKLPMDAICTEAFDGDCEVYKELGLKRVVHFRYVDGAGSPGTIEIYLSQFATSDGSYAMFTRRVIADSDPVATAPRRLDAGGAGMIGTGRAYVWRGPYLAEIQYANEQETVAQMKVSSDRLLTPVGAEIGAKMAGSVDLPRAAGRLPQQKMVPLGIAYTQRDVLGVDGAGPGATGFYRDGDKRYRVLSIARDDVDQAKDVMKTFARIRGATEEKGIGDGGWHVMLADNEGVKLEWVIARSGKELFGVGDEQYVTGSGMTTSEHDAVCLTREQKVARLRAILK
jgi:hypothetical protein